MTHIRVDNESENSKRKFACGIGPDLPPDDVYFFEAESIADRKCDCPKCREALRLPAEPRQLGTPISELSGRPGHAGYEKFAAIARSWGYD